MTNREPIKIFKEKKVRTVWDNEQEKWYFSISDIVRILTDSKDPKQYIKKMRIRDPQLKSNWGTICTLVQMTDVIEKEDTYSTSKLILMRINTQRR